MQFVGLNEAASAANGGRTSNSPPCKVRILETYEVLASGFDSVAISVNVEWKDEEFFETLREAKRIAALRRLDEPVEILCPDGECWNFNIRPYGHDGYAFLLSSREYGLSIGDWLKPKSRPSVFIEIRSETIWHLGLDKAIQRIAKLFGSQGGQLDDLKASRIDLCLDMVFPASLWSDRLREYAVTRATAEDPHFRNKVFTGLSFGKGNIMARVYDKPLEIAVKSKKYWMYDIWKFARGEELAEDLRIVRSEFQLRRATIKELGVSTIWDAMNKRGNIWGYCTTDWLKFQDGPGLHHTQRHTFPWWLKVSKGFGEQACDPAVRKKALTGDVRNLVKQTFGYLASFVAAEAAGIGIEDISEIKIKDHLCSLLRLGKRLGISESRFVEMIQRKFARYHMALGEKIEGLDRRRAARNGKLENSVPASAGGKGI